MRTRTLRIRDVERLENTSTTEGLPTWHHVPTCLDCTCMDSCPVREILTSPVA